MMKKCQICGHDNKPSAFCCSACGESTWFPSEEPQQSGPSPLAFEPEAAPQRQTPRGSRSAPKRP